MKVAGKHAVDYGLTVEPGGSPYIDGLWEITFAAPQGWDKLAAHVDGQLATQGFWLAQAYPLHEANHAVPYERGEHSEWASRLYYSGDGLFCACVTYLNHRFNKNNDDHTVREDLDFKGCILGVARFHRVWPEALRLQVAYRCELERQGGIESGYLAPSASAIPAIRDKYADLAGLRADAPAALPGDWPLPELTLPHDSRQRLLCGEVASHLENSHVPDPEAEHREFHAVDAGTQPYVYHDHQLFTHLSQYSEVVAADPGQPGPVGTWTVAFWANAGASAAIQDAKRKLAAAGWDLPKGGYDEPDQPTSHYRGGSEEGRTWTFHGPDRCTEVRVEHFILEPWPYLSAPTFGRWVQNLWPRMEAVTYTVERSAEMKRPPLIGP